MWHTMSVQRFFACEDIPDEEREKEKDQAKVRVTKKGEGGGRMPEARVKAEQKECESLGEQFRPGSFSWKMEIGRAG